MRSSNEVIAFINKIAEEPSKNEKQRLVTEGCDFDIFRRVCEYAYNPFKTYGVRKIPAYTLDHVSSDFTAGTWLVLDDLINRNLTGQAALDAIATELHHLDEPSAELLKRIIRKDLRAGFSESTINKACKGLIPDFPYMRCSLPKDAKLDKWNWEEGVISQEKADGMFANVDHEESGLVRITSRQGSEFPIDAFEQLATHVRVRLKSGTQSHGEIVVYRDGAVLPREIGNGILNSVLSGGQFLEGEMPVFLVWDQIPLSEVKTKGKYKVRYKDRLVGLIKQLHSSVGAQVQLIPTKIVHSLPEAYKHYAHFLALGKEGTVIKSPDAIWMDGTSKEQVKLKLEVDVDLKVIAIVPGREGTKNEGRAGSLTCESSCGKLRVDVAIKGEAMRDAVDAKPDEWIGGIMTVRGNSIMHPSESNFLHSMFLPRFVEACLREKTEADDLQRIKDQFDSAIKVAA